MENNMADKRVIVEAVGSLRGSLTFDSPCTSERLRF